MNHIANRTQAASAAPAADRHQKIYITLTIREVFLPDGEESYWAAFNDQGTKVAPWSDSDSPEEVKKKLVA